MRKFLLALSLLSIAVSSDAFAQQQRSGTPEEQAAAAPAGAIRQAAPTGGVGGITLDDVRAVKEIVDRIGADRVRELADVLSK